MVIRMDGKACECEKGEFLLDIARRNGLDIPTLCHHEGLGAQGCCRVCLVEVEDRGRCSLVVSCVYPVEKEIDVYTNSEAVKENRAVVLALLKARAPGSPEIAAMFEKYGGMLIGRFGETAREKCVLCALCTRACESLGSGAIATAYRGVRKQVAAPFDDAKDCIGCASCAKVCPTGAIPLEETGESRAIWGRTFELARCEACGAAIGTREEIAFAAKKSELEESYLCGDCRQKGTTRVLAETFGAAR